MRYFEDIEVGTISRFGSYRVDRDEVIEFASKYDPQPFHLSDEAAAKTHFGRIAASGWHTCGMAMRMVVDNMAVQDHASLGGVGIDEIRWVKPVYPGDVLRCESELIEKKQSRSRPEMATMRARMTVFNQHDEPVMTYISIGLIATRPVG